MIRSLIGFWFEFSQELKVVLFAAFLFILNFLFNLFLKNALGSDRSPYFDTLYNKRFKDNPYRATTFGIAVSTAFLICLVLAYIIMLIFRQIGNDFSYKTFAMYSVVSFFISVIANAFYAKQKLGLPFINKKWWKELGADISKRAHENMKKNKKNDDLLL